MRPYCKHLKVQSVCPFAQAGERYLQLCISIKVKFVLKFLFVFFFNFETIDANNKQLKKKKGGG